MGSSVFCAGRYIGPECGFCAALGASAAKCHTLLQICPGAHMSRSREGTGLGDFPMTLVKELKDKAKIVDKHSALLLEHASKLEAVIRKFCEHHTKDNYFRLVEQWKKAEETLEYVRNDWSISK